MTNVVNDQWVRVKNNIKEVLCTCLLCNNKLNGRKLKPFL